MDNSFIVIDGDGIPAGIVDVDKIQSDGLNLAFLLAAQSGNEDVTERILAEHVERHGTQGIGYVLMAAIKHMTNDILAGAFDVMEQQPELNPDPKWQKSPPWNEPPHDPRTLPPEKQHRQSVNKQRPPMWGPFSCPLS